MASHVSLTCRLETPLAVAFRLAGAAATGLGVAFTLSEPGPAPAEVTARTLKVYSVSLVRPVTVWVVVAAPLPGTSVQLEPPSLL